jgi:hypothetical protein
MKKLVWPVLCRRYVNYTERVIESKCCGISGMKVKANLQPVPIFVYQSQVWISSSTHTDTVKVPDSDQLLERLVMYNVHLGKSKYTYIFLFSDDFYCLGERKWSIS